MIPLSVTVGEDLFFPERMLQIVDILQHTAENICSFGKKAHPGTEGQEKWEFLKPFLFISSETFLIHAANPSPRHAAA